MVSVRDYCDELLRGRETAKDDGVNLWEVLRGHRPDRVTAVDERGPRTFGELVQDAETRALLWSRQGIRPGDVVGVQLPNNWEFMVAHAALARLGAVMAPIHVPYSPAERLRLLQFVRARGWVGSAAATVLPVDLPLADPNEGTGSRLGPVDVAGHDPLALFFTSGTHSVKPKPCLHSHAGLIENARTVAAADGIGDRDVLVTASPFTHLFGILALHLAWVTGATQVLVDRFRPEAFVTACHQSQATVAFMVPTHVRDVLRYLARNPDQKWVGTLRELRVAGAALPPDIVEEVARALDARVVNHWGMSELGAGLSTHWQDAPSVPVRSIGRPVGSSEVRVVTSGGRQAATGETGELWFRGPSLFYGYYRNADATRESLTTDTRGQVWFKTGDLAAWGSDGRVEYRGRVKDLVIRGGMKISALEVETAVLELPGVRQAALLPEPDSRLGERGCLVLTLEPTAQYALADVCQHLAERQLAKFKWPERLVVWDSLPTTATGKIAKAQARERLLRELKQEELKLETVLPNGEGESWNNMC